MSFPWILSMCVGFLSLSQEILWVRYGGFSGQGMPGAFALILSVYLLGIARGAMIGREYCETTPNRLYSTAGKFLVISGVLDIVGPLVAAIPNLHFSIIGFVYVCALLKGIAFPIAHHLGSAESAGKVGTSISRVYFMNIIGSSLGPIITGFWLVDVVSLHMAMQIMGALSCVLGVVCMARENSGKALALPVIGTLAVIVALVVQDSNRLTRMLACYPKQKGELHRVVETKSGIIHSSTSKEGGGDYVYGGNVYDGRSNIDPRVNSNILERVFLLAAIKPEAERVLVIGMSTGAWTRIVTSFPGVKRIDVIEINPGYIKMIEDYPDISPILKDPRVHIHVDDGRRWLKRNTGEKFDMVVMNTTFHWRNYATNLLSREFLELVKKQMNPGAVIAYNTTDSPDVLVTAEAVFPYAFGYLNFAVASDEDFRPRIKNGAAELKRLAYDGKPVFKPGNVADKKFIERVLAIPFLNSQQEKIVYKRQGEVISDWNMITEYKHGITMGMFCN